METNFRRYWDDIRKTLIIYSLVPILALFLIGYPLQYYFFVSSIQANNKESNLNLAQRAELLLSQQLYMVEVLADTPDIKEFLLPSDIPAENTANVYAQIYGQINTCDLRSDCFVLDTKGSLVLSTSNRVPTALKPGYFLYSNLLQDMKEQPGETTIVWYGATREKEYAMYLGQAIEQNGQVIGYVVCYLTDDTLSQVVSEQGDSSARSVIANQFGYPFAGNIEDWLLDHGKLSAVLREDTGKVTLDGKLRYLSRSEILDGRVSIYTITDIEYIDKIFVQTAILLLGFSGLLALVLLLASRRIAKQKSNVLDNMLVALKNVREGNLSDRLVVDTGDEFQIFAEEYNRMLTELEKLIAINKEIGRQTAISEIKQLESQFNPHFLFNTLSAIRYMIAIDESAAQKMIVSLCELLRYSIKTVESQTTLGGDWQYTQQYLSILKYRFGEKLCCGAEIAPETLNCLVPKLLFQPIIENAVTYGFESTDVLHLNIAALLRDEILTMTITNDGDTIAPERLREIRARLSGTDTSGRSIGLYNIHRRIQLLYGADYGVTISSTTENGTVVQIQFPAQRGD